MDKSNPSVDPSAVLTALASGMAQLHEFFRAALDAGFSEDQAMRIVLETIRSAVQPGASS